jgi:hypothetical protein
LLTGLRTFPRRAFPVKQYLHNDLFVFTNRFSRAALFQQPQVKRKNPHHFRTKCGELSNPGVRPSPGAATLELSTSLNY